MIRIKRLSLAPGVLTPIYPVKTSQMVDIQNLTGSDLMVHTNTNELEYLTIKKGEERHIHTEVPWFRVDDIAFWLESANGGTVVTVWV